MRASKQKENKEEKSRRKNKSAGKQVKDGKQTQADQEKALCYLPPITMHVGTKLTGKVWPGSFKSREFRKQARLYTLSRVTHVLNQHMASLKASRSKNT